MLRVVTPRLDLVALTEKQLRLALSHSAVLLDQLGCHLDDEAVSDASRRAIFIKLEKMEGAPESTHGWFTYWMLIIREQGLGVGMVGFKGTPGSDGEVEIGYGISQVYQSQGYMTEAVRGLVDWAFQQPECLSVRAETLRTNLPSHRVLQKSGFQISRETQLEIFWRIRRAELVKEDRQDEHAPLSADHHSRA
ncbi:MAG TPA: GNAT family N-acetyltransferase [Anaerolineaceae bacterium]|jgi:RimJ/RimL family protein N-acetyltransferase